MAQEDPEIVQYALAYIRREISELQQKERILEAQLRLRTRGKKGKFKFVRHDDADLHPDDQELLARTHEIQGKAPLEQKQQKKRKRKMSAAGRKAISDAAKARWAREKAEKAVGEKKASRKKR